ncbi:MAG: hypothetical protein LQ343_006085 [Gyalolechia ehrenbergii]|nr:MAG: hypothetical protein LQ343_006085 [Gyalolechia ehrenbergii]
MIFPDTQILEYSIGSNQVVIRTGEVKKWIDLSKHDNDIFSFLKFFIAEHAIERDDDRIFCGGLMGYVSYEACLETLGFSAPKTANRPDLCFAFIERSILLDHRRQVLYVNALLFDECDGRALQWVRRTSSALKDLSDEKTLKHEHPPLSLARSVVQKTFPQETDYKSKISKCQDLINAGESYELCLTDQTSIRLKDNIRAWNMYIKLRSLNSANFGAFVRLGPLTLLSTSPERFMKWSRFQKPAAIVGGSEQIATCQFRPMKGTVRKEQQMPDGSVHQVSREQATAILASAKEQAENLMILDLIRHDLHGVCNKVCVPGLMVVEEYGSVYQLVSVIEGTISKTLDCGPYDGKSGIDCLCASLPPGSMTGAPKKRSCELLREIERKPRSVYSGVLGYIDVSGNGDFSVLIRNIYRWVDECDWKIGAGGAITTLSTEEGEWDEMLAKLHSTYRLFDSRA